MLKLCAALQPVHVSAIVNVVASRALGVKFGPALLMPSAALMPRASPRWLASDPVYMFRSWYGPNATGAPEYATLTSLTTAWLSVERNVPVYASRHEPCVP